MSLKDSPAPHYQGKVGLKRKLTGPSRLLLGKCKSRYKQKNSSPRNKTSGSHNRRSNNSMLNHNYSVQEETAEELPGGTPNSLSICKESTGLESSSKPWYCFLKPQLSENKKSKAQENSRLNSWRKFFYHVLLCPRHLKFKPALGDEDQSHDFTFYNQQTRDSFDLAIRPSIIYQVVEEKVAQQSGVVETKCRQAMKTKLSFWKGLFCLQEKQASPKPNHTGLEQAFVVQEDSPCLCLSLRKQLRHQVRHRAKKPSPFFQERIGSAQEYIQEETIVLSNRHTDEDIHSICQSVQDESPHTETVEVSVDVMPGMSECESKTCALDASYTESCGKSNLDFNQDNAEYDALSEGETLTAGRSLDETNEPDISSCQKQDDDEKENNAAVNALENLIICEMSVTTELNQHHQALVQACKSTVNEDGRTASHSSPANNSNIVLSGQYESGQLPEEAMDTLDEMTSCPEGFLGKNGYLDICQRIDSTPEDDVVLHDLCDKLGDLQPPEILLYQTARLLVKAAMEAALRQLENDLMDSFAGCYEETGDH